MTDFLKNERSHFLSQFENSLDQYLAGHFANPQKKHKLVLESMQYSLKSNGKRFRPLLSYLVFSLWSKDFSKIKSWCLALEFIHTYSLIHDDLPCMDNDDYRRGVLTNHKVYGDDVALLAGDSLISEAFKVIADDANLKPNVQVKLIQLLASKIGPEGMVTGQVLDMKVNDKITEDELKYIHILKTGYLIQTAAVGAGHILELGEKEIFLISEFALNLGLSFQIKDDLLDHNSADQDFKSYVYILGLERTKKELELYTAKTLQQLKELKSSDAQALVDLIQYNVARTS
ncbi:MAG: polyprenyl synthetase family protein [Bdellovibrio sp.]|nr:polyprenyl synthetase family protein [Bdellovibrio sp.]